MRLEAVRMAEAEFCARRAKRDSRARLATAAAAENPDASKIATFGPVTPDGCAKPKISATSAAPIVCPRSLAVD